LARKPKLFLKISLLLFVLFSFSFGSGTGASAVSPHAEDPRHEKGLFNNEPASYSLMSRAGHNPDKALDLLEEAEEESPDFPPVYFRLSFTHFSKMPQGLFNWSYAFFEGLRAYGRNWWWLLDLSGLLVLALGGSFLLSLLIIVLFRLPREFPLLKHDMAENRRLVPLIAVLLAAATLGPVLFSGALLMLLGLYFRKRDRIAVYLIFIFLALLPLGVRWVNFVYSASTPALRAAVDVNEGRDNQLALEALAGREEFASRFSRALALKREGRCPEAIEELAGALSLRKDPRAYTNLANCYYAMGDMKRARENYEASLSIRPAAASFLNLSRLDREEFNFTKGDEMYREAVKLDPVKVSNFVRMAENFPQNNLMDERLRMADFYELAWGMKKDLLALSFWAPEVVFTILSLLLAAAYAYYLRGGRIRAYRCSRCTRILCPRCEREPQWGQMCKECYQSLVKLEVLDPKERVSRLLKIHGYQVRRAALIKTLSFAPPGIAYIFGGKVLPGLAFLWSFLFFILFLVLDPFFGTGLSGFEHNWLNILAGSGAGFLYLLSIMRTRRRQGQGWL
jgi:tetratricopeptide (TPR) repeat protein